MTHGSIFNGIGGFQLAALWAGWENVMSCEIDEFCNKVTKYHFRNCVQYGNIKETDFSEWKGKIDVISGGFPCQPFSNAGKRKGTSDDRHLWPEMLRAIREISPRWIVGENVRGLINWSEGVVFDQVQSDLESEGYEVLPFLLPACGVNAPHRRDRIWIVAHASRDGHCDESGEDRQAAQSLEGKTQREGKRDGNCTERINANGYATNPVCHNGGKIQTKEGPPEFGREFIGIFEAWGDYGWKHWPTQHPVCGGINGFSSELDGITFSRWRKESIKAYGNAIVPQVAYQIFKAINEYPTD